MSSTPKERVRDFWQAGSCGEVYAHGVDVPAQFEAHRKARYELEPYIPGFARFDDGRGKDVLEIGVGMGADHLEWAKCAPKSLSGVDLTPRAIEWTTERLRLHDLESDLRVGDAESLPFDDNSFDIVYSWGVVHCSPDTRRAMSEIHRVLRPGGEARIMIYHSRSIVGYLLWLRYGLLRRKSLRDVYTSHLESPGTKAYTVDEARELMADFDTVDAWTILSFGDLLEGEVGQQHPSRALEFAKRVWPRRLIRATLPGRGLYLLIRATK